jgi:hypothetical protein
MLIEPVEDELDRQLTGDSFTRGVVDRKVARSDLVLLSKTLERPQSRSDRVDEVGLAGIVLAHDYSHRGSQPNDIRQVAETSCTNLDEMHAPSSPTRSGLAEHTWFLMSTTGRGLR